jgi:hypothetical protein
MDARQSVMPVTAPLVLPLILNCNQTRANGRVRMAVYARGCTMDATYFRDKAETCLRLAKGLSWNNPARGELMELPKSFSGRPRNSKPRRDSRLHADADFFSASKPQTVRHRHAISLFCAPSELDIPPRRY